MIELTDPVISPQVGANITQILQSGALNKDRFTDRLTEIVTADTDSEFAIPVTSCTTGLELALSAFGIGEGDEVIVPDFTYPAPATVVNRLGATPVLVDVTPDEYTIDIEAAEGAITDQTAALIPVSLFGQPFDPAPINQLADEHDLVVIEDAAWSYGAAYDGQPVGSQFDCSVFSFHGKKPVPVGEGGIITTDRSDIAYDIRTEREFGFANGHQGMPMVHHNGTNYKLSELQAAVAVGQLKEAASRQAHRHILAKNYTDQLATIPGIDPPNVEPSSMHSWGAYCAVVTEDSRVDRDQLTAKLHKAGIETAPGSFALHTHGFQNTQNQSLPTSRTLFDRSLKLPLTHSMTEQDVDTVVQAIGEILTDDYETVYC